MTTTPPIYEGGSFTTRALWSVGGVNTDPTTVKLKFQLIEAGPVTTWVYGVDSQIVHLGPGYFAATIATTQSGIATVQWEGTGAAQQNLFATLPILELPL